MVQNNIIRFTEFLMKAAKDNQNVESNNFSCAMKRLPCLSMKIVSECG